MIVEKSRKSIFGEFQIILKLFLAPKLQIFCSVSTVTSSSEFTVYLFVGHYLLQFHLIHCLLFYDFMDNFFKRFDNMILVMYKRKLQYALWLLSGKTCNTIKTLFYFKS